MNVKIKCVSSSQAIIGSIKKAPAAKAPEAWRQSSTITDHNFSKHFFSGLILVTEAGVQTPLATFRSTRSMDDTLWSMVLVML